MTQRLSFTKYENEYVPSFRQKINEAESTEDVKKFFAYTVRELLERIFGGKLKIHYEDVALKPNSDPNFFLSERLLSSDSFKSVWENSDLPQVVGRLAKSAIRRYRRLEKHKEKTDAKIRM